MRAFMKISREEDLQAKLQSQDQIVLYGELSLVRIVLRYMQKNNLSYKVIGVSLSSSKKMLFQVSGYKLRSIRNLSHQSQEALVLILENSEEKAASSQSLLEGMKWSNHAVIDYDLLAELGAKEHVHMGFICVGFVKCGTSSLHMALKKHKGVILPKKKETLYLHWRNRFDDAPERFNSIYFGDIPQGKVIGSVEPSYHAKMNGVYECCGPETKIIFMVRNPMSATYSYFKMLLRKSTDFRHVNYYLKYFHFDVRMFDRYIKDYILSGKETRFCYIDWIREYLKYFKRENIKIVVFEELIRDPKNIMNEIQDFIGVERQKYESLPHTNEGKSVSKNYLSALVNSGVYWSDIVLRPVKSHKIRKNHEDRKKKILEHTLIESEEKMLDSSRETLQKYYEKSIHELEEFCGKSFEGLWY